MTRQELIERLTRVRRRVKSNQHLLALENIDHLLEDIGADGVLDVQAPVDIADSMSLPVAVPRDLAQLLFSYGSIRTVVGVTYPGGTHKEALERLGKLLGGTQ